MPTQTRPAPTDSRPATRKRSLPSRTGLWQFARHYVEMIAAMFIGMMLLGPVWTLLWPHSMDRADVGAVIMATDMVVGMAAWMRIRRSSWPQIAEMSAAMYLPFLVLLLPYWSGMISGGTLLTAGQVLMLVTMAAAMLRPRRSHTGHP